MAQGDALFFEIVGDGINASSLNPMLHPVMLFGALGVVEAVKGADEVAGNAADALEGCCAEIIGQIDKVTVYMNINAERLTAKLCFGSGNISIDLFLGQCAACYVYRACHLESPP
jgi:hypothetical protein